MKQIETIRSIYQLQHKHTNNNEASHSKSKSKSVELKWKRLKNSVDALAFFHRCIRISINRDLKQIERKPNK